MGMNPTLPPTAGLNSIFRRIADDVYSRCSSYVYVLNRFSAPNPESNKIHSHPIGILVKAQKKVVGMVL